MLVQQSGKGRFGAIVATVVGGVAALTLTTAALLPARADANRTSAQADTAAALTGLADFATTVGQERTAALTYLDSNSAADRATLTNRRRSSDSTLTSLRQVVAGLPGEQLPARVTNSFDAALGSAPRLSAARKTTDTANASPGAVVARYFAVTTPAISGGSSAAGAISDPALAADLSDLSALSALADGASAETDLLTYMTAAPGTGTRTVYAAAVAEQSTALSLITARPQGAAARSAAKVGATGATLAAQRGAVVSGGSVATSAARKAAAARARAIAARQRSITAAVTDQLPELRSAARKRLWMLGAGLVALLALSMLSLLMLRRRAAGAPARPSRPAGAQKGGSARATSWRLPKLSRSGHDDAPTTLLIGYRPPLAGAPSAAVSSGEQLEPGRTADVGEPVVALKPPVEHVQPVGELRLVTQARDDDVAGFATASEPGDLMGGSIPGRHVDVSDDGAASTAASLGQSLRGLLGRRDAGQKKPPGRHSKGAVRAARADVEPQVTDVDASVDVDEDSFAWPAESEPFVEALDSTPRFAVPDDEPFIEPVDDAQLIEPAVDATEPAAFAQDESDTSAEDDQPDAAHELVDADPEDADTFDDQYSAAASALADLAEFNASHEGPTAEVESDDEGDEQPAWFGDAAPEHEDVRSGSGLGRFGSLFRRPSGAPEGTGARPLDDDELVTVEHDSVVAEADGAHSVAPGVRSVLPSQPAAGRAKSTRGAKRPVWSGGRKKKAEVARAEELGEVSAAAPIEAPVEQVAQETDQRSLVGAFAGVTDASSLGLHFASGYSIDSGFEHSTESDVDSRESDGSSGGAETPPLRQPRISSPKLSDAGPSGNSATGALPPPPAPEDLMMRAFAELSQLSAATGSGSTDHESLDRQENDDQSGGLLG